MPKMLARPHSRVTAQALKLLARQIKLGRKERGMTAQELAQRIGVSRGLVQRIEQGDPGCQIGAVFEAATIVGVTLFEPDVTGMKARINEADGRLALLPKHTHSSKRVVKDDF